MKIPKTFEEQVATLDALGGSGSSVSFRFFTPLSVSVEQPCWDAYVKEVDISNGGIIGGLYGRGYAPEDAVQNIWDKIVALTPYAPDEDEADKYLVIDSWGTARRHIVWNNFMWKDIPVKIKAA